MSSHSLLPFGISHHWVFAASLLAASAAASAAGHVIAGSRLSVDFADPATGWTTTDVDRVDHIAWTNSSGVVVTNLVANGGPLHCNDPQEFFGQSWGEPEGTTPLMIFGGSVSTWKGSKPTSGATTTSLTKCADFGPPAAITRSSYKVYTSAGQRNQMLVTRRFLFDANTPQFSGHGLRAYAPRLPIGVYNQVLIPNAAGTAINTVDAQACGGDCEVTDWNGRWFADDDGAGNGLLVIRALSSKTPALVTVNNDGFSASNLSSIVVLQPGGGWKSTLTETEALCFYDALSWPAAQRQAGALPAGCSTPK